MNKVILLGRLTKDPDVRYSQATNTKVALFSLAVERKYVKQGEERQTDFINIICYSKNAEFAEKYFKQGLKIALSGRIETRNWTDDNGVKHYTTNVIAEEFDFADSPKKVDASILNSPTPVNKAEETLDTDTFSSTGDDIPF